MHQEHEPFPGFIASLPAADIPLDGLTARLLQAEGRQVLFMEFSKDAVVPEHSHAVQWGVVLDGEMELTTEGKTRTLVKGDTYFIPDGISHSAVIRSGYRDITVFGQADRYAVKHRVD